MTTALFHRVCGSSFRLVDYEDIHKVVVAYRLTLSHGSQPGYTVVPASNTLLFSISEYHFSEWD